MLCDTDCPNWALDLSIWAGYGFGDGFGKDTETGCPLVIPQSKMLMLKLKCGSRYVQKRESVKCVERNTDSGIETGRMKTGKRRETGKRRSNGLRNMFRSSHL